MFDFLPVEQVRPHTKNVRTGTGDPESLKELADSIKSQGILQPLAVAPHLTLEGDYVLIAGHRRFAAAKAAGLTEVPCFIRRDLATDASQVAAMLVENTQRSDLTAAEEATGYQFLLDLPDYTVSRIAKEVGRSQRLVKERLKLKKLPDEVLSRVGHASGQISIERALTMVEFQDDPKATAELEKSVAAPANDWAVEVKRLEAIRDWRQKIPALRAELEAAGVELVKRPQGEHWAWKEFSFAGALGSFADAAAAGLKAIVDERGGIYPSVTPEVVWVRPFGSRAAGRAEPVQMSAEEVAEQEKRTHIEAGLQLVEHVRAEFLKAVVKKPSKALVATAATESLLHRFSHEVLHAVLGLPNLAEGEDQEDILRATLKKMGTNSVVVLHHIMEQDRTTELMSSLSCWDPESYWGRAVDEWVTELVDHFGYELTDIEREARQYWADKADA